MGRLTLLAVAGLSLFALPLVAAAQTGSLAEAAKSGTEAAAPVSPEPAPAAATQSPSAAPAPAAAPAVIAAEPETPAGVALKERLLAIPEDGTDEEKAERAAALAVYAARRYQPLWVEAKGFSTDAVALRDEIGRAAQWGLDPADFAVPQLASAPEGQTELAPAAQASAEVELTLAALKYARYARGGRIVDPARDLNSNLDRRPQFIDPKVMIEGLVAASGKAQYLAGTNPKSAQFERLRQKYLALGFDKSGKAKASRDVKRLLANMEMWRWMPDDLGDVYLMANVPSFMIDVVKGGQVIDSERVVVGETGKQTSIFSRPLKMIVFKPMWRVPESIKVKELWPSLLRGGGLMRQYGLELESKDGRRLDYRTMDWAKSDIRDYEVVQPSGRRSVMGNVKFAFPSQHTIFMHDTPDKWMFNSSQRTLSHGCLRLRNPLRVAELILKEDKGWDPARIAELVQSGPDNNEVPMDHKIRMHIVYFTAWVDDAGALKTYSDIYGHEKRVTQALEGKWQQIAKGVDHLAPVQPNKALAEQPQKQTTTASKDANSDFMNSFIGGF